MLTAELYILLGLGSIAMRYAEQIRSDTARFRFNDPGCERMVRMLRI